ncbi:MAG: protein kinase [Kofleriaceae bacterium]
MAERQFGPYRLVRQIAVGGMAEIHLAKTKGIAGFEKYVALKMIHPNFAEDEQFIQMLVDEAKIAVQLAHGNIAQTFDLGRVGDTYYITMEYVDGADLYKILRRGSEQDVEMPLDVCAYVAKDIASALDHAHRKRDHLGKPLGIVHRDVSPQNVLVSYAGEVKLVDFGIAKATMKVRQTAAGVIKGKYYYMSPEQAWGDKIDHRSDIFSAGIVLYEMITGQMLYLEEDLHKLLDMARKADIEPPTRLRKGVPLQLERIVMRALAKSAEDRYQSAGDFANDLERFLHAYSPVFTASKIAALLRKIVGDPIQVPDNNSEFPSIEYRDGTFSTQPLDISQVAHVRDEISRDENSVIFRVDELKQKAKRPAPVSAPPIVPSPPPAPAQLRPLSAPRVAPGKIPSITRPAPQPVAAKPAPRVRGRDEETRQLERVAPPDPTASTEESGLLLPPKPRSRLSSPVWDGSDTEPGQDVDGATTTTEIGHLVPDDPSSGVEHTMITGAPRSFLVDPTDESGVEATMITAIPSASDTDHQAPDTDSLDETHDGALEDSAPSTDDDGDGPTIQRAFVARARSAPAPPALSAKIHAPAVSALRTPKPSRRTPPQGIATPPPNLLQAIVSAQVSEPMPEPRTPFVRTPHAPFPTVPPQFPHATPGPSPGYDASGLPLAAPLPTPSYPVPGVPPHLQPYLHHQGLPPNAQGFPPTSPNALYQFSPYGSPQPLSLTGQLRLSEIDELPSQYRLDSPRKRWLTYILAGTAAVVLTALATFFIIKSLRSAPVVIGSVRVESVPAGADVIFDGTKLDQQTPLTIDRVEPGARHDLRVELPKHRAYLETINIPASGGEYPVMALLKPITGKLVINTRPGGAEVRINDQIRGVTPITLNDVEMATAKRIELRLKDHQPIVKTLDWPTNGQINIDETFKK